MSADTPTLPDPSWIHRSLESSLEGLVLNSPFPKPLPLDRLALDFQLYLSLLISWGQKMDLVSPAPAEEQLRRHFIDSFLAAQLAEQHAETAAGIMDVGSGAGFPGLIFAICRRERPVFLVEPREKRCLFLREVKRKLGLTNVQVLRSRFEQLSPTFQQPLDLIISRALGSYPQYLNTARRILSTVGGRTIAAMVAADFRCPEAEPQRIVEYRLAPDAAAHGLAIWDVANAASAP